MASPLFNRYIAPMAIGQSPCRNRGLPPRQFRRIPVRTLAPNLVTLLALCAGLTGIRMAFENRYGLALAAIVFAAVLDGIDGRLARLLKGTSKFGAELDSLSDFVNFGVAPALILYFWGLHDLKSAGWIAAMAFAICAGLRLARFNVMSADPDRPAWAAASRTTQPPRFPLHPLQAAQQPCGLRERSWAVVSGMNGRTALGSLRGTAPAEPVSCVGWCTLVDCEFHRYRCVERVGWGYLPWCAESVCSYRSNGGDFDPRCAQFFRAET